MQRTEHLHVEVKIADWADEILLGLQRDYRSWEDSFYDDRPLLIVTTSDGKTHSGDKLSLECAIDPVKQYGRWRIELNAYWDDEYFRQRQMVDVVVVAMTTDWDEVARFEAGTFRNDNGWGNDWSFDVALTCDVVSDELYYFAENFRMALSFAS
jgi:hypothetical protein